MRRNHIKGMILSCICMVAFAGCKDKQHPEEPPIFVELAANNESVSMRVAVPQGMTAQDRNVATWTILTGINTNLSQIQAATERLTKEADAKQRSWQTFWLCLFGFWGVIAICLTTIIKTKR